MISKHIFRAFTITALIGTFTSCNKIVNIQPPATQITNNAAFSSDVTALAALQGLYVKFITSSTFDYLPTLLPALSADELINHTSTVDLTNYSNNDISITDPFDEIVWRTTFNIIYQANALLENVLQSTSISSTVRNEIQGEALFMRAFMYFELVNFYGSVPLETSTNVLVNASLGNTDQQAIYFQIISDLSEAASILNDTYPSANRARVNKSAANALLARVYLYQQNWDSAAILSTLVINDPTYSLNNNLSTVFIDNSPETIFQYATANGYTDLGKNIISLGSFPNYAFTNDFISSIEAGDLRASNWMNDITASGTTYIYPYKYKQYKTTSTNQEYLIVLRLAEQFLIRAEANAQLGNLSQSLSDLNTIRTRAGLRPLSYSTQDSVLTAIYHERRMELFTEWGHRWFDLKRTQTISQVLGALKPSTWTATDSLYPVPSTEISANPALTQNPGY